MNLPQVFFKHFTWILRTPFSRTALSSRQVLEVRKIILLIDVTIFFMVRFVKYVIFRGRFIDIIADNCCLTSTTTTV